MGPVVALRACGRKVVADVALEFEILVTMETIDWSGFSQLEDRRPLCLLDLDGPLVR